MDICKVVIPQVLKGRLYEIPQHTKLRMAFARIDAKKCEAVHPMVLCRDFLNDVVAWNIQNTSGTVFGFSWNSKEDPIDPNRTCLLLDLSEIKGGAAAYCNHARILFAELEQGVDIIRTTFQEAPNNHVIVIGDVIWQKYAPLISVYSCFLRLAANQFNEDWKNTIQKVFFEQKNCVGLSINHEIDYIVRPGIDRVLALFASAPKWREIKLPQNGYKKNTNIYDIHNFGFVTLLENMAQIEGTGIPFNKNSNLTNWIWAARSLGLK